MACNVFGSPVSAATLKGMPEYAYKDRITRAEVALALKNAEGKDVNARSYVENISKKYPQSVCVLGLIYNATGALLRYHGHGNYNWHGSVATAPYPVFIENGQWGAFVFVQNETAHGIAHGSVMYRGYNFQGGEFDFFLGWLNNKTVTTKECKVCVDVDAYRTFDHMSSENVRNKVVESGLYDWVMKDKNFSTAIIGNDKVAVLEVIHRLTLQAPIA